jgi:hypothetical protein
VTGKIKIQSSSTIAQLKHATSTFKEYLLEDRVHINNAQLGPEEAVVLGWIPGSHPAFSFRDNMRESIKNQMPIEYANVECTLFPKTIYYTRASDGVKLSTSGVSVQVNKQPAGQLDSTREDIAKMWQKVSLHKGGPLVGKHFVPFGKSGNMGDSITTQIIHRQNAMLKSTKQRVLTNLNDIDTIIEMETPKRQLLEITARLLSGKPSCPTRTTPEHRFSALLRVPKLEAHIASYSMTIKVNPLT